MRLRLSCALALVAVTTAARLPDISVVDTDGNPVHAQVRLRDGTLVVTAPSFLQWSGPLRVSAAGSVKVVLMRPAIVRGRVATDGVALAGARVAIRRAGRDLAAATSDSRG